MGYYWGWFISPNIGYYWLCHEKHVAHFELHISYFWQFHLPFHFHRLSLKERLQLNIYLTSRRNISFPFSLFHWQLHFWCLLGRVKHLHLCRISANMPQRGHLVQHCTIMFLPTAIIQALSLCCICSVTSPYISIYCQGISRIHH